MKEIQFYKMVATGNDFVVIDNRKKLITDAPALARKACDRHFGVGADGLLLLEDSRKADYKMRIFNRDGSEAEACGNGFRCVALLAHRHWGVPSKHRFESLAGIIDAEVKGPRVRVGLVNPEGYRAAEEIEIGGRKLRHYFIEVGVPHVVIFVEGLAQIPVVEIGRAIRYHPRFQPAGTNVNFVELDGEDTLQVETYERGVETNTLACGTGSTASALVGAKLGYVKPPVRVETRGGEMLNVDFETRGGKFQKVSLEGEVHLVFEGKLTG